MELFSKEQFAEGTPRYWYTRLHSSKVDDFLAGYAKDKSGVKVGRDAANGFINGACLGLFPGVGIAMWVKPVSGLGLSLINALAVQYLGFGVPGLLYGRHKGKRLEEEERKENQSFINNHLGIVRFGAEATYLALNYKPKANF